MISKEDAEKLKQKIIDIALAESAFYRCGSVRAVCNTEIKHKLMDAIDTMTDPHDDPMEQYVGTDRLMEFRQHEGDIPFIDNLRVIDDGYYYASSKTPWKYCTPYLSDTVEAMRLLIDEGKVLENEKGTCCRWRDGQLQRVFSPADDYSKFDNSVDTFEYIATHTWQVVEE